MARLNWRQSPMGLSGKPRERPAQKRLSHADLGDQRDGREECEQFHGPDEGRFWSPIRRPRAAVAFVPGGPIHAPRPHPDQRLFRLTFFATNIEMPIP